MIYVNRNATPPPPALATKAVRVLADKVKEFYSRRLKSRRQERFEIPWLPDPIFKKVMERLKQLFANKCGYCETPFDTRGGLDRFRPMTGAIGLQRDYWPDHYWWLAYEWRNIYAACEVCNKIKGPKFPVTGDRVKVEASWTELEQEQRLLIDPCRDDPADDLEFLRNGQVQPRSNRGDVTIGVLELNRPALVRARKAVAGRVIRAIRETGLTSLPSDIDLNVPEHEILRIIARSGAPRNVVRRLENLGEAVSAQAPYAAVARALARGWLSSLARGQTASTGPIRKQSHAARHTRLRTHFITGIELKGFRGLADLKLTVPMDETATATTAPWLMLLGENGSGKSSILQAIAITLSGEAGQAGTRTKPAGVLRQGAKAGHVRVHLSGAEVPLELVFKRGSRRFTFRGQPPIRVVLAYGATRLLPNGPHQWLDSGMVRVRNLFDPFQPLIDADKWLGRLKPTTFDYVARALKDVLSLPRTSRLKAVKTRGSAGVRLRLFGAELSLEQLSDGYQSVLGLTCDIIAGLMSGHEGALEAAEGTVLLDELGAHLHPRWRMRIVNSLRKAFPRVQFIVSTHDPLCLRGLENGEVVVLRRTSRGRIYVVPDLPPVKGMRVDQLLTSEYFGLSSTMDPEVEAGFNELYRLLALRKPSTTQSQRITELSELLKPHDPPGTTRRERRLLEIIDSELAKIDDEPNSGRRKEIEDQANTQIAADLEELASPPAKGSEV